MEIIQQLKSVIESIKREDLSAMANDQPLNLDSIQRITLIAELENTFNIEISSDELDAEVFDSLQHLSSYIEQAVS